MINCQKYTRIADKKNASHIFEPFIRTKIGFHFRKLAHQQLIIMTKRFWLTIATVTILILTVKAQTGNKSVLQIKEIMSLNYIGESPTQFQWSPDSRSLYFRWDHGGGSADSAWMVDPSNPVPVKVPRSEVMQIRPQTKLYNADKSLELLNQNGNYFLIHPKKKDTSLVFAISRSVSDVSFTHTGNRLIINSENNLYLLDPSNGQFKQLTNFQEPVEKSPSRASRSSEPLSDRDNWLVQDQIRLFPIFQSGSGQRGSMAGYRQGMRPPSMMRKGGPSPYYLDGFSVYSLELTPDERFVTFIKILPSPNNKTTIMPTYVTRSGYTETLNTRSKVGDYPRSSTLGIVDIEKDSVYEIHLDQIPGITDLPDYVADYPEKYKDRQPEIRPVSVRSPNWSPDGRFAILEVTSADNKDRWILLLEPSTGDVKLLDRQRDEAWIGGPGIGYNLGWMPDGKRFWFQSEESGYSHLYWINPATGEKQALTSGSFEVYNPRISKNNQYWYFLSNESHPGERHYYRMPLEGGKREQITTLTGGYQVTPSPDEKWLALEYSTANRPAELYLQKNQPGANAIAITDSRSDAFKAYPWRMPEFVTIEASDGETIHARLYRPEEGKGNQAAVIFVHGAGYLQNAHKWWSTYYHEYMFHNILVDNGFTVLDLDYRGSSGYGRDWRTGIYRHMGGKDLSDNVDGAYYLVSEYGINPAKIGIYGGSYGGFITLMAMFNAPDVFAAGAGLRSVTDWAHYNHGYTANILNTPAEDSIAYIRSSPINFAEGLKGKLLMCHGVMDDNVHFQDIVRLSQRLIDLGKDNWELAIYPLEAHSFKDPAAWTDEYKRIFKLFAEMLK
jgi:dipeptidyl aminopeptidase/acylaminoacyl peptidase